MKMLNLSIPLPPNQVAQFLPQMLCAQFKITILIIQGPILMEELFINNQELCL